MLQTFPLMVLASGDKLLISYKFCTFFWVCERNFTDDWQCFLCSTDERMSCS